MITAALYAELDRLVGIYHRAALRAGDDDEAIMQAIGPARAVLARAKDDPTVQVSR